MLIASLHHRIEDRFIGKGRSFVLFFPSDKLLSSSTLPPLPLLLLPPGAVVSNNLPQNVIIPFKSVSRIALSFWARFIKKLFIILTWVKQIPGREARDASHLGQEAPSSHTSATARPGRQPEGGKINGNYMSRMAKQSDDFKDTLPGGRRLLADTDWRKWAATTYCFHSRIFSVNAEMKRKMDHVL